MSSPPSTYKLLSCTRYDPFLRTLNWNNDSDGKPSPFLLLRFHVDRLVDAAERHAWVAAKAAISLDTVKAACQELVDNVPEFASKPLKIRLLLDEAGRFSGAATVIAPLVSDPLISLTFDPSTEGLIFGPIYNIYLDTQPTPSSIFTSTKTTERTVYEASRARRTKQTGIISDPHPDDILLYNDDELVTESTICNVALYRDNRWLTPSASTGCLPGVFRRWLLELGRIHEDTLGELHISSVKEGDWVLLFNGVAGCRLGRVVKSPAVI
ncbi:hypothetical protein PC9H_003267 [Pleurotus ostreatus]|uniref:Aminodeoxychorismate lyase n=2 Tax=Pleurotus TaxID=5320 RepID=A0A8H7A0J9_PLEOS|nr:uncharacterized protein PC9H_003267 [Pleurotus ostreatus]KAF7436434.1 hypothetical protein PC9H_003267 [Pleurotus ostreatus]KAG9222440.1 hypothetical protein CCMSSC00406_0002775 [Pleurotus cornucopiae]